MVTSANFKEIELCLMTRAVKRKIPRFALFSTLGAVLVSVALVPLPKSKDVPTTKVELEVPCAFGKIKDELTGQKNFDYIAVTPSIQTGGVESGEVICENRRYRYTLDIKEAKRVLKLLELDS